MRITVVQVSAGSKYDPSLVPNLPARKVEVGARVQDGRIAEGDESAKKSEGCAACEKSE